MASCILLARYASNWFVCLNSEKSVSKVFSLWSNPNKEPKLGRSCREELGTVASVGTGVCCRSVMRGVGGGGRIVVDKRGGSTIVVNGTLETDIREKDEKSSKNGQNRARNGKAWKSQSQVKPKKSTKKKSKSNLEKLKVKPEAETEEMLNGPT
ncbi:hypothetical protein Tco_0181581, partial [Tanacetum coccineum]